MKKLFFLYAVVISINSIGQNVGIGTTSPLARLHVADSNVVFTGPTVLPLSTSYSPAIQGAGSRMLWYPQKAAFRAGNIDGPQWDKDNIGRFSFATGSNTQASYEASFASGLNSIASGYASTAMGYSTIASGAYSTAMGFESNASGFISTAMGVSTNAVGDNSTAIGFSTIASGQTSTAMGYLTTASGYLSTAMGYGMTASGDYSTSIGTNGLAAAGYSIALGQAVTANSWNSTSLGTHNDPIVTSPTSGWVLTEPLLIVGNGTGTSDKKNALAIAKNGNVYIDPSDKNDGTLTGNTLLFGVFGVSGEGISSKRTATGNQWGLDFYTQSFNRMSITNGGNVGIGTTSPGEKLTILSADNNSVTNIGAFYPANLTQGIGIGYDEIRKLGTTANSNLFINAKGSGNLILENSATGNVGIGTSAPLQKLHVAGNICATGSIGVCSDIRYKKNLSPIHNALASIQSLNGIYYYWKQGEFPEMKFSNNRQLGFSAQEVEKIFPEIVMTDANGYKSVDYGRMTPVLVESIKEQQQQIELLRKQIGELTKMIESMRKQ